MQSNDLEPVARRICSDRNMRFVAREGEGTFKQTFHVEAADKSHLALKLYKAGSFTRRDQREIDSILRCNHKNIVRLLSVDSYLYDGQTYDAITEEFLQGGTLTARGQITVEECLRIGEQLIEGIAHIASLELVHRDLKPDNIMFRDDRQTPVITDFGVVRDLADSSFTPTWAPRGPGTPFFAPPEQLNNQKELIDWRSDQFSLGIVLSLVTFGDHPYRLSGMSDTAVVDRVSLKQSPADSFLTQANSTRLRALKKMIAVWPIDRFRKPALLDRAWRLQVGEV